MLQRMKSKVQGCWYCGYIFCNILSYAAIKSWNVCFKFSPSGC